MKCIHFQINESMSEDHKGAKISFAMYLCSVLYYISSVLYNINPVSKQLLSKISDE